MAALHDEVAERLEARRRWIAALGVPVLVVLLSIAVLQAVAFALGVRRWLIAPLERVAAATHVIATGDLSHRLEPEKTEEFSSLGRAVNSMAVSLQAIQRRVEMARAARQRAAGAAREAERRRLARELHDGILQDLSAVRLGFESEASGAAGQPSRNPADAISGVIAAIRSVVDDLRPPALSGASLAEAISGHARVLTWARGIDLTLDLAGAPDVPEWAVRDLYRIAQEGTANALRHANPTRLWIRLVRSDADTVLEVEDDGVGFDPETSPLGSGIQGCASGRPSRSDLEIGPGASGHAGWVVVPVQRGPPRRPARRQRAGGLLRPRASHAPTRTRPNRPSRSTAPRVRW